ncbi:hypothetical protein SSX86_004971 [Deinandra increscens subsp. villosa]|uniref:RRM domain-containing protein n=1 Tax=Deinandra increscens subsp. villosa TaxID=3103831 RepID=A0AAP0DQ11_9ASTR
MGNYGDGEWTTVRSRRQKDGSLKEVVFFYIADLPHGCTSTFLWHTYRHVGRISDAFVPQRKDWRGRTFGFIRFKDVSDVDRLLSTLRSIKVDGARVRVYVSKFRREENARERRQQNYERSGMEWGLGKNLHMESGYPGDDRREEKHIKRY